MEAFDGAPPTCDVWLWDGSVEYEGVLTRRGEGDFSAHIREAKRGDSRTLRGTRISTSFFDLQKQFVGRRFLACFRGGDGELLEADILSVQRSSVGDFAFFLCGRYRMLDRGQQEVLKKLSIQSAAALLGS